MAEAIDGKLTKRIDLSSPLSLRTALMFPLQSRESRADVLIGALVFAIPVVGWILNMGHRIVITHRMQHGESPWPAWGDFPALLRHGMITLLGMIEYHAPAVLCGFAAWYLSIAWLYVVAVLLWIPATVAVPGYMTHYFRRFDPAEVFNPLRAMRRVFQGGRAYWHAWSIVLVALTLSLSGLLVCGVGFLVTSVWFWQVAAFSFGSVFTQTFQLAEQSD